MQKGKEYAILTDEITRAWAGMNTRQYKNLKGLKKENLRDNMSDLELVLTMLAEASTTDIAKAEQPQGFDENQKVARRGGNVAGVARKSVGSRNRASPLSPHRTPRASASLSRILSRTRRSCRSRRRRTQMGNEIVNRGEILLYSDENGKKNLSTLYSRTRHSG